MAASDERIGLFRRAALFVFIALLCRLGQLQIVQGDDYFWRSENQRLIRVPIDAARGRILDRNGVELATDKLVFSISMLRATRDEVLQGTNKGQELVASLSAVLQLSESRVRSAIEAALPPLAGRTVSQYEFVELNLGDVSPEAVAQIYERRTDFQGIIVTRKPVRIYPLGDTASQLVGYIRRVDDRDYAFWHPLGYSAMDLVGKLGIEKALEQYLRGTRGAQLIEVDSRHTYVETLDTIPPERGDDIVLTIDSGLQRVMEQALGRQIALNSSKGARTGSAVAIDIRTGDILAIATRPGGDLNAYLNFTGAIDEWPGNELDRASKGALSPGSVYKAVTAIAGLEAGVVDPTFTYNCRGVPDSNIAGKACHGPHGTVDMMQAIAVSCNSYFWTVSKRIWEKERKDGSEIASRYARELGLGQPTGWGDQLKALGAVGDFEASGNIPVHTKRYGDAMNAAIGQGDVLLTPLQAAQLYATIARSGLIIPTRIVKSIRRPDGSEVDEVDIESTVAKSRQAAVDKSIFDVVKEGLSEVVEDGTGSTAFAGFPLDRIPIAGKTGTAEVSDGASHGWFVAYAPADDPQIAVAAVIEHGGYGSGSAAPVVRKVLERYFGLDSDPASSKK